MSKFCGQCGNMLSDDAVFCGNCGAKVQVESNAQANVQSDVQQASQPMNTVQQPAPAKSGIQKMIDWVKMNPLTAGIVGVVAVAAVVGVLYFTGVFGSDYEDALDNYVAIMEGDITKDTISRLYPEELRDEIEEDYGMSEFIEEMKEGYADEMPSGLKCSYDVSSEEEITGDTLDSLKEMLNYEYDIDTDDIGGAYNLEIDFTMEYMGEEQTMPQEFSVVEIDGEWYLIHIDEYDGIVEGVEFPEF